MGVNTGRRAARRYDRLLGELYRLALAPWSRNNSRRYQEVYRQLNQAYMVIRTFDKEDA